MCIPSILYLFVLHNVSLPKRCLEAKAKCKELYRIFTALSFVEPHIDYSTLFCGGGCNSSPFLLTNPHFSELQHL